MDKHIDHHWIWDTLDKPIDHHWIWDTLDNPLDHWITSGFETPLALGRTCLEENC